MLGGVWPLKSTPVYEPGTQAFDYDKHNNDNQLPYCYCPQRRF